jgi:hypothetical protein
MLVAKSKSIKSNVDLALRSELKTKAKQLTGVILQVAFITDPLLLPVLQAGLDQLKGLVQLMKASDIHE